MFKTSVQAGGRLQCCKVADNVNASLRHRRDGSIQLCEDVSKLGIVAVQHLRRHANRGSTCPAHTGHVHIPAAYQNILRLVLLKPRCLQHGKSTYVRCDPRSERLQQGTV